MDSDLYSTDDEEKVDVELYFTADAIDAAVAFGEWFIQHYVLGDPIHNHRG